MRFLSLGNMFLPRFYDYALIGGGLSLVVAAIFHLIPSTMVFVSPLLLPIFLIANHAHFAASTVRLYNRENALVQHPVLTCLLPWLAVFILGLGLVYSQSFGAFLQHTYLLWSPYHYAAQAYGLCMIYLIRSGLSCDKKDRTFLKVSCLLPCIYAWATRVETVMEINRFSDVIGGLVFVVPVFFAFHLSRKRGQIPLIVILLQIANGCWWVMFPPLNAFFIATIFHAVQYLAIASIFEARSKPEKKKWMVSVRFYLISLGLGFVLFHCLPRAFVSFGFGYTESVLLCAAMINIHHFIVDGFIWKFRRDSKQRKLVESNVLVGATA